MERKKGGGQIACFQHSTEIIYVWKRLKWLDLSIMEKKNSRFRQVVRVLVSGLKYINMRYYDMYVDAKTAEFKV